MNGYHEAIENMTDKIALILGEAFPSIYLYGSAVLDEFGYPVQKMILKRERFSEGKGVTNGTV